MKKINRFITFPQGSCRYRFLSTGDVFTFTSGAFLVNQFRGNAKDGSANNIYLRIYGEDGISVYPLLGIRSESTVSVSEQCLRFEGCAGGISYQVTFCPHGNIWFWNISLTGCGQTADVVYGQDLGMGPEGGVYTNELYMSQYLGHTVFESENGYVVCSRQNMPAGGCTPYLQQGTIGAKAVHYSTDGLQFFGLTCKETGIPESLSGDLPDVNLQYECAYTALQTEKLVLNGTAEFSFYGLFCENHPDAVRSLEYGDEIFAAFRAQKDRCGNFIKADNVKVKPLFGQPFSSSSFTPDEIHALFPQRTLEEKKENLLFSFFTPDHAHVVTKEKELVCERPHGTIIITPPDEKKVNSALISSTQYMYGIFNSHTVTGNTDMHKLLSTPRGFLNLQKNSGQRIYVKLNGTYHLLNLPGLFEMGMNYSRWFYKTADDIIIITAYTAVETSDVILEAKSQNNISYEFIVTHQLVMGTQEFTSDISFEEIENGLRFTLDNNTYPGLHYDLVCDHAFTISDDRIFFTDENAFDETFLTLSPEKTSHFSIIIRGRLDSSEGVMHISADFEKEKAAALSYYDNLIRHFHLEKAQQPEHLAILNETIWWYAHNAMIHFSMPHGLEQPGGAAWGTRDICQGPMEFFLTTQHYDLARDVLCNIFAHQSFRTREWNQWFMFDRYHMNAGECHGDVIFWPLKCIADYLAATGDYSILTEELPYDDAPVQTETLLAHISRALDNIRQTRLISHTGLITYAGGDWDDTLQPANDELKQSLVSAWTIALAYQTFRCLADVLKNTDSAASKDCLELAAACYELAELVKSAFENILIKDGIIAGFLECRDGYQLMLHPCDEKTGIHYRLLPMTRSIIAELASYEQALANEKTIQENLKCPDGVRLMDHPASYDGGVSHLFKRAEQAANVGREISLQYTHAHIRYIEAMAKLGKAEKAWNSLFAINPILIGHSVPNARIRQSNMYFSSSEGAYTDRYDYAENFHLLKTGSIEVKGGWRLYSSGPGIYLRQLVGNVLGIRFSSEGLIIDPVLPAEMNGASFTYDCFGKKIVFRYHIGESEMLSAKDGEHELSGQVLTNPYRSGALLIDREKLLNSSGVIDIYTA
ncbi:MAG: cellobiose phosphorylase [Lachnospiraceae bacterium]|nr:cellobiose phosphorylase [Lachnospiraceae bacterium]